MNSDMTYSVNLNAWLTAGTRIFSIAPGQESTLASGPLTIKDRVFILGTARFLPETMLASENALRDWVSPEEDSAWAGL